MKHFPYLDTYVDTFMKCWADLEQENYFNYFEITFKCFPEMVISESDFTMQLMCCVKHLFSIYLK